MTEDPSLSRELTAASPEGAPAPASPAPTSSLSGHTVDRFEVLELLGAGGFGEVYRARDARLGRMVALKVLPETFARDAERRERFRREAMAASALNHPSICTVHDLVEVDGRFFIVMELVEGKTIHATLAGGPLPPAEAAAIAAQVAEALAEAHGAGILHRDIKGGNIVLTPRGQVKVLDFGLAKRLTPEAVPDTLTREGTALGTLNYMSPEQLLGQTVDGRSDLFSLGVLLYEMLTGRLPFRGSTAVATADAILHREPADFGATAVPDPLRQLVRSLLEKDPSRRPAGAREVVAALKAYQASGVPRGSPAASLALAAAVVLVLAAAGAAFWLWRDRARVRDARDRLPEIARLVAEEDFVKAAGLAREARTALPGDAEAERLFQQSTIGFTVQTEPPGAQVSARRIGADASSTFEPLGAAPLAGVRLPKAFYLLRAEAPGHRPAHRVFPTWTFRLSAEGAELTLRLDKDGSAPEGMERVGGGKIGLAIPGLEHLPEVPLDDFWIDRLEVTNADYKRFVDAGGYEKRELWRHPFVKDGRTLPFEEAVALFRDGTGSRGPATWELGTFPEGEDRHPVAGVSWFEAAAYAEFAGKSLPSIYHWNHAAQTRASQLFVPGSNFNGARTVPTGGERAVSGFGTFDMAGNVKEWCANESGKGKRFILGGGFGEPTYMFIDQDAQSPWDRRPSYGFRCVKLPAPAPPQALLAIEAAVRDFRAEKPASDETFRAYKGLYLYDRTALNPRVEATETTDDWTRETVSFDAAYGNERVVAYLYLPKNAAPPYQTVLFFPGSSAINADTFSLSTYADWVPKSGRALISPVFKGTWQRRSELVSDIPAPTALWRDHVIAWTKDVGRSLDYLETRSDIDAKKLAYLGFSWGSAEAPVILAVEPRFSAAIFGVGGFCFQTSLPEVEKLNFVTRVTLPVLMLNGRYDHFFPVESSQKPLFELLGTPAKDKKHVIYETGHAPPRREIIAESLAWLDRYLGSVKK